MKSVIGTLVLAAALAAPAFGGEVKLETDEQKTIYALGLSLAGSLASYDLSAAELEILEAGLTDGVLKNKPKVEDIFTEQYLPDAELRKVN